MSGFLARSAGFPFLCGNAAKSIWAGNPHTLAPRTLVKYFSYTATSVSRCRWFCRKAYTRYGAFLAFGSAPKASRGAFSCFGSAPVASTAHFRPSGVLPRLPRHISDLRECSHDFPDTFSAFGSAPLAFPAQFCPSGAFPRLSGVRPKAYIGIVRAWRGNHTKSFHQEDEPWHRQQWQR